MVLLLLAGTVTGAWLTHTAEQGHQRSRFDAEVRRVDAAIEQRMTAYVQVLRGGAGLFNASDEVTRADWRRYVDTLRLDQRYPGFKSLSWAPAVPRGGLSRFVARVHREQRPAGLRTLRSMRDYTVRAPAGAAGTPRVHAPILWVAPFSAVNQRVLGVDMMREPRRRVAMNRATRSESAVLSPRLRLSGSDDAEPGFIAYVAVTRDGKTAGWLTAAFLAEQFFDGLLGASGTDLDFEVDDGEGRLLHSTAGSRADGSARPLEVSGAAFDERAGLAMPGRWWRVRHVAPAGFVPLTGRLAPWLVLLAGLLVTGAFFVVGRVAERWRRQADLLARQAEDLRRARRDAEEAARAKAAFLATMSHEIRTPMNAVIGMSAVLMDTEMTAEQRAQLAVIRSGGEHLLHVINDILDFSKLEAGKVELEDVPFAVRACVASAVDLMDGDARAAGIALQLTVEDDVPGWISGDAGRLRQVLLNLVSNAVKFTPRGGRVDVAVRRGPGSTVTFVVRDTGPGIPVDAQERLFAAFEQAEVRTSRVHGGTGLGLSIARRLVEAMGGTITVDSAPGAGATFRVAIPAREAEPAAGHDDLDPTRHEAPGDLGGEHPLRILVAEDSAVNRHVARALLERLGYAADIVDDGRQALDALARQTYDVVLLDLRMPVLDGLQTAREICRDAPAHLRPWLVAMTADVLPEDRATAAAAGLDDFIAKPVTLTALAATLRRAPRRAEVGGPPGPVVRTER